MFDLAGNSSAYDITLEVSFDNGTTYTSIEPNEITGSLNVSPGNDIHLIWDGRISYPNSTSSTARIKIIANSWSCGDPITDSRDGQTYNTVEIGTQCWMAENLNYETGNSWCYDDNSSNCDTYGRLYDWSTALGACPTGWHLPSDDDWCTLTTYIDETVDCESLTWIGTDAGYKMKSTSGWYSNGNGSDAYGFTALPGGYRDSDGIFHYLELAAYFWSSTAENGSEAWNWGLGYGADEVNRYTHSQGDGLSVRCLKD
ncbi:MAG: fibrobacter succinogenes major paralogous domain-containing protein [Bacteroidales bacterium]|nr:fibrobacter succinogenes major paralogous domain-containing protein [Bacteroidales bacterium]MCF8397671.1 fibrobacter succinogenes major paralogous domain-containing protein [Bacteroidales bacterium]